MGLYDYLRCDYPLPIEGSNDRTYQTKCTPSQYMDMYVISKDGKLMHEEYDTVDRSDPNAIGLQALIGCAARENQRLVPCNFSGSINFYDFWDSKGEIDGSKGWLEFMALFDEGQLIKIKVVEETSA